MEATVHTPANPAAGPLLTCRGIVKSFGRQPALDGIDLALADGERMAVLGPSGCGKSTLLRIIAGLERADGGSVCYKDKPWSDARVFVEPEKRDCGLVFQDLALFPHLSVSDNIGFGINAGHKADIVAHMLKLVNLVHAGPKMIHMLSGGEQQRVALARALAPQPGLLLLDEPFSSLDLKLRQQMRTEVRGILMQQAIGAILVTHDQIEAFSFADRIAVMQAGKVLQVGPPDEIYFRPATVQIADFVGDANFLDIARHGPRLNLSLEKLGAGSAHPSVILMCRPEDIHLSAKTGDASGRIVGVEFQGDKQQLVVALAGGETILASAPSSQVWQTAQSVGITLTRACWYGANGELLGWGDFMD
jgi:iron(III) transport system ATP-binding protein